jgi:D-3-phosphoglycerate dehydrogenase
MSKYKVLYLNYAPEDVYDIIRAELPDDFELLTLNKDCDEERKRLLAQTDFLIVATAKVDEETLSNAPNLKMIQHQGVGYEKIDLKACARRGIAVGLTPEGTSIGVAEHTLLLILAVYKQLPLAVNSLKNGKWLQFELRPNSYELYGKTLGLVGMGRIGQEVAKRAQAFDCKIIYTDPVITEEIIRKQGINGISVELAELATLADIVSIHTPLTAQSKGLINAQFFTRMKPSGIVINTSRGGVVDEQALIRALETRQIAGAGLDVFAQEPPLEPNPLFNMTNVVATPHIAAGTRDALQTKMGAVFANLRRYVRGEELQNIITKEGN